MTFRTWVSAALVGALVPALAVFLLQVVDVASLISEVLSTIQYALPPLLILLLVIFIRAVPTLWNLFRYWSSRHLCAADAFFFTTALGFVLAPIWAHILWDSSSPRWVSYTNAAGAVTSAMIVGRALGATVVWRRRKAAPPPDPALISSVIGDGGLEPLLDIDEDDALDRRPFVDALEHVLHGHGENPLTFGLEGPWGSGKTSILNSLESRLHSQRATVVRFDAWNFREPERVVGRYLAQLSEAIRKAGGPMLRSQFRQIGLGLAPLAGSGIGDSIRTWLASAHEDSLRELLEDIRQSLRPIHRQVVVMVDDLDRLDRDELHAALRTVRLVATLPGVAHVLAYDRNHLSRILFPTDDTQQLARDYLGKIVHVEFSLARPTPEASTRLLAAALQPLLDTVSDEDAQHFLSRLRSLPRQVFVDAMPTPRDLRRVAAAVALLWPRLKRDVNLFDLFVLQVVHTRFPKILSVLQAKPEWFTEQEWSGDLWRISEGERWRKEAAAYTKGLWDSEEPDGIAAARLLALIFPSAKQGTGYGSPSEAQARRERRASHPEIFPRYFQLSVPRETLAESSVEDLAEKVKTAPAGTRGGIVHQAIINGVRTGKPGALFEQWEIFEQRLAAPSGSVPFDLARDIAIGIAQAAVELPGREGSLFSPQSAAAGRVISLARRLATNKEATDLVCEAIRHSRSFDLSGTMVSYLTPSDDTQPIFPTGSLDLITIRSEFDAQVRNRLLFGTERLLDLSDDDIAEVLYRTSDINTVRQVFTTALSQQPDQLPRILKFPIKLSWVGRNDRDVSVVHDGLAELHPRLDLENILRVTEKHDLPFWNELHDRALVRYFRKRVPEILAAIAPNA